MTSTPEPRRARGTRRLVTAAVTVGVAAATIVATSGGTAQAAELPQAQSVGNYLDATLGGMTLDSIAKVKYARAVAPGSNGVQNPLDATLFNAVDLPLTGALQLPSIAGIDLGAVTQKARANVNGQSYGQAGTALDSGGVQVTDKDSNDKAGNATIDLTAAGLAGNSPVQLPGGGSAAALGGVQAEIGGISSVASTPKGYAKKGATAYQIANIDLSLGSPLLGQTLATVLKPITDAADSATSALGKIVGGLTGCTITAPKTNPLSLAGGAITIDSVKATIEVHLAELLKTLGLDLNNLPPNTDLLSYLLAYLADPNGLAKGLQSLVDSIADPLQKQFDDCLTAVGSNPVTDLLKTLSTALKDGKTQVDGVVSSVVKALTNAAGVNPLKPLADALSNLLAIGVNVQPNGKAGTYTDPLAKTPKQGTSVVKDQTIVRAIEINVAAAANASLGGSIPSLGDLGLGNIGSGFANPAQFAPIRAAAPGGTGILTLALANAAAGPSVAPSDEPTPTPTTPTPVPTTEIPTGVPAGQAAGDGGAPLLPLVAFLAVLGVLAGGIAQYRTRGKYRL